jgi:hypothetical protein
LCCGLVLWLVCARVREMRFSFFNVFGVGSDPRQLISLQPLLQRCSQPSDWSHGWSCKNKLSTRFPFAACHKHSDMLNDWEKKRLWPLYSSCGFNFTAVIETLRF